MTECFGENIAPTAAIRAILGSYPFSVGLFREILQNSDDAGASKQIFVLDRRLHGTSTIYDPFLATAQGPALLAFNNALIQDDDWKALQNIHRSSKKTDTSKIGKYGIGFRSCYHVTDTPHILSGSHLAILDPKHDFAEFHGVRIGGIKLNIEKDWEEYTDHLAAFDSCLPRTGWGKHFHGTVFRLPLRTTPSDLSNQINTHDEISGLLKSFALEELQISPLFLRKITSIEIREIEADGRRIHIATSTICRTPLEPYGQFKICRATINTYFSGGSSKEQQWRILHAPFSEVEALTTLSHRLGSSPSTTLSQHKLAPTIDLAIPLDDSPDWKQMGRLFTFLPLPLATGFPVHINALFALTQSRQNLRNGGEVGIMKRSDDHVLIEWNRILFGTYIPQAWAGLLEVLVEEDQVGNIFSAWPRLQAEVNSGDYVYWKDMPVNVMQHALSRSIWPVFGADPCTYGSAGNLIFATGSVSNINLAALVHAGLQITQPPQYLTHIIGTDYASQVTVLSPQIAHSRLLNSSCKLRELDDDEARSVLSYLLSTSNCSYIVGLPLIRLVSQARIALKQRTYLTSTHTLLEEIPEELFSSFDGTAVSLKSLSSDARNLLVRQGCQSLNIAPLQTTHIIACLRASSYASPVQPVASSSQIAWLNVFWSWTTTLAYSPALYRQLGPFYLVPTTQGFQSPMTPVFDAANDDKLAQVLELLGVPLIDRRLNTAARAALKHLKPTSQIHDLLHALPPQFNVELKEDQAQYLCSYLIKVLPPACATRGPIRGNQLLRSRLRALPIFPTVSFAACDVLSTRRTSIVSTSTVRGVHLSEFPVLPQLDSLIYLDLCSIDRDILPHLDPKYCHPLTLVEMQSTMLTHFSTQSFETQAAFVKFLDDQSFSVPRGILDRLADLRFVPTSDGSLQAPRCLVDPEAQIALLYPGASSYTPNLSRPLVEELVSHLRNLGILMTKLSIIIVVERIRFIAKNNRAEMESLACILINLIHETHLDCRNILGYSDLKMLEWIPTKEGLKKPLDCRDRSSHSGMTYLFDEVFPLVKPSLHISPYLRFAFKWDGAVDFGVLSQQLVNVLSGSSEPYSKVREVIEELSKRDLTESQLFSLRDVLQGCDWVPTRDGGLKSTSHALLGLEEVPAVGFHCVVFLPHHKAISFLRQMGCHDEPPKDVILGHLEALYCLDPTRVRGSATTRGVVRLLEWLPPLNADEQLRLVIPDISGVLRKFNEVCYNDLGGRAYLVDIGERTLVHPSIHDSLARQLGLQRLGLFTPDGQDQELELDMGEDLVTTIRNRLREYTDSQLLLEFLANTSDAGATEFNVLLDESDDHAPIVNLLSQRCEPFQRVPALIIHNNGIFSEQDFAGILRTGIGGKSGKKDTIGQFGLGALTMFHVTEFAMIVSGDQVLFLNPCKSHLPVSRASLRISLTRVRKIFSDHLFPLVGMFGFDPPKDVNEYYKYHGTIFRLPLRSSSQFVGVEPVFKKVVSFSDVTSHFEIMAPKCLLFTNISDIKFFSRQNHRLRPLWSLTATRDEPTQVKQNTHVHTVSISSTLVETQIWRVMSISAHDQTVPSASSLCEQYRLRMPPVARIAACQSPANDHDLFSTLPLPITLNLPVHISASFILASDRRSIRLDEYENIESCYNRWLLTTIVPQLYLSLLEDRAMISDNRAYWPGNAKASLSVAFNAVSTMIIDAVYQMAATSGALILRSRFHNHALSLRSAHFSYRLPPSVQKVLELIQPQNLVKLPSPITQRLRSVTGNHVSLVSPEYVRDQILANRSRFDTSALEFDHIQGLIDYQAQDGHTALLGLPLLPLEDNTFTQFEQLPNSCFFVAPFEVHKRSLFESRRLVHHNLLAQKLLSFDPLNVKEITSTNIGVLLSDRIQVSPTLDASPDICKWIEQFWKAFPHLRISSSAIAAYPLVPTLKPGFYLSINNCKATCVALANFSPDAWLSNCLIQMGFTPVDTSKLPAEVRSHFNASSIDVESVVSMLFKRSDQSIDALFNALDAELHLRFVSWIKRDLSFRTKKYFGRHPNLKSLPIWRIISGTHVSAYQVQMLPRGIALEAVERFAFGNLSNYNDTLSHMGIKQMSVPSILFFLDIPKILAPEMDSPFATLVNALASAGGLSSLPLPNSERAIVQSNTLFSSQDSLFLAAFDSDSSLFILPSFRSFEDRFSGLGIKRQRDLSMSMFLQCATAFQSHNTTGANLVARASVICRIFTEDLPLRTTTNQECQWKQLDKLRFIPRNMTPTPLGQDVDIVIYVASHVKFLPEIVSPSELVRPEFAAIAWTQRALYQVPPHQRVLMAYPGLSVPTANDVVNHLISLATTVAQDYPGNALVLSHIKQTYEWLNNKAEEATPFLAECANKNIPLFLNVDDPTTDDWSWMPGNHILLENYDTGFYRCVRDFLKPYSTLLIAAGAANIDHPDVKFSDQEKTTDDALIAIRSSFDQMRHEGICTDVSFTFEKDDPVKAHRSFLAAYCSHFKDSFSGGFHEAGDASSSNPIKIPICGFSRRCVEYVLDYAYTEMEPKLEREDEDIELVLEMLQLTHSWAMLNVHCAMQNIMIKLRMIDPFNLDQVRGVAKQVQASVLLEHCAAYEKKNSGLIQHARASSK